MNEDHPKFQQDAGATMFGELSTIGLTESVVSVRWDPAQPETIPDEEHLVAVIAAAKEKGVKVVLALYPAKARAVADNGPAGFVDFCRRAASAFPEAAAFIVGNEPNQPRFWQPQFKADGSQASAAAFLTVLAGCYDAIHPTGKQVIGVGLSPRGNDNPRAPSNVSTSPVRFIRALGAAYRASGRRAPIMDAFSFHAYPNENTDPPFIGYEWPNAGMPNFDRIKQALWDAFNGTRQPHIETGLAFWLDEVGWQVPTEQSDAYTGVENVSTVDEAGQAAFHGSVVRLAACDHQIEALHFFHWIDESDRGGFQSGAFRADGTRRPAFDAIAQAVADTKGGTFCPGERGQLEAQDLGRRRSGEAHATAVARDPGHGRRECDRDVRPRRRRQQADAHGSRQEGRRRRARLAFDPRRPGAFRCAGRALDPSPRVLQAPARRSRDAPPDEPLCARNLDRCGVQSRQDVALRRSELRRPGELSWRRRRPRGRCWRETARVSGSVKAPLGAKIEAWFEYGPRTTLTRTTKPVLLAPNVLTVSAQLADLRPYARWSYRLVVRERGKPATKVVGATRVFMLKARS